jgi:hypothetical protein
VHHSARHSISDASAADAEGADADGDRRGARVQHSFERADHFVGEVLDALFDALVKGFVATVLCTHAGDSSMGRNGALSISPLWYASSHTRARRAKSAELATFTFI